ncbi:unnamed protein product [Heterobilharzia americana]|nr:unnamed protein product [Heterobilharzia americana]
MPQRFITLKDIVILCKATHLIHTLKSNENGLQLRSIFWCQLDHRTDDAPITPWVRGEVIHEGMVPADRGYVPKNIFGRRYFTSGNSKYYNGGNGAGGGGYFHQGRRGGRGNNRYYYHAGQRIYYNNKNGNENNYRSRCASVHSLCASPMSLSQSQISMLMDEYIDDCLSTDIEQYQLKLDMDSSLYDGYGAKIMMKRADNIDNWNRSSSPSMDSDLLSIDISQSSSTNNQFCQRVDGNPEEDYQRLKRKSKSSLNLSTPNVIANDCHIDNVHDEDHVHDNTEEKKNCMDDGKFGNMNDYHTLVWGDLRETIGNN